MPIDPEDAVFGDTPNEGESGKQSTQTQTSADSGKTGTEGEPSGTEGVDFTGLPFDNPKDLVEGYKTMARSFVAERTKRQLAERQAAERKQSESVEVKDDLPTNEEFWNEAIKKGPQTIAALIEKRVSKGIEEALEPDRKRFQQQSLQTEVSNFRAQNPEVTDALFDEVVTIIEERPSFHSSETRLDDALAILRGRNPEKFQTGSGSDQDLKNMKSAATALGGKGSSTQIDDGKDEFDDILALDEMEQKVIRGEMIGV